MRKLIAVAVAGAGLLAGSMAIAADDPIAVRQAIMKDNGAAAGALGKMAKGEAEFDALKAELALRILHSASYGFGHYFPEGSETGMDTRAKPEIWSDRAGFEAALVKFQEATSNALANLPKSQAELGETMRAVGGSCGGCHKPYRAPNS